MAFSKKRTPYSKTINPKDILDDRDINDYKRSMSSLKNEDFKIKIEFDKVKDILDSKELKLLKLSKLLYCCGHKKDLFLYLGIIIESKLNLIVQTYLSNRWQPSRGYINELALNNRFNDFIIKFSLSEKANDISTYDLFNNHDISDQIKHKLQAFRFLRNYGGHAKGVNHFLESVIDSQPECDNEITDALRLLLQIELAYKTLLSSPPSIIS